MIKIRHYFSLLLCLLFLTDSWGQSISINTSDDKLYLYDDFNIKSDILTNTNSSTGIGWSDGWVYQSGHSGKVAVGDGYIYTADAGFGITRDLANPIKFVGSTYYVSFLFKKNSTGKFRISGYRHQDKVDRFGIHIEQDGKIGAQAGVHYNNTVFSDESFIENDKTYLVVAKYYYTDKPNINISVFAEGETIPTTEPDNWNLEVAGAVTGMQAIEYFRLAFSTMTTSIDELKLGDTWNSVSTTEVTGRFPEVVEGQLVNSDVQTVDQELTDETKSWSYTVENAGNYQIGYAWIWVDGEDDENEVDITVQAGGETIKSFTAKSAIAPYRFETRLENLEEGDEITVTATPKDDASYELNYHLAYATPTFEGLTTVDVASYGAVGDGVTNDYQAIKEACKAVEDAEGGIVTFDGSKTYYVEGGTNYALFDFFNVSNIKVKGNGAKIILHPKGNFIRMDKTENIQIDGFTTTYGPLPYFQGNITAMNVDGLYLDMQVDARFDAPVTGEYVQKSNIFGRTFWVTIPDTEMGEGRHLSIKKTEQIGDDDHAIRVFLQDGETNDLQYSKTQNATDFIIPHILYGHEALGNRDAPYCNISRSSRVTVSNVLTHSVCHFAYTVGGNYGPITFTNTDVLAPDERDMHVAWRDGWHVWGNRYGIMVEDGDFDGGYMYDDIFSPHVNVPIIESGSGTNITLKSKPGESYHKYTDKPVWQVGDLVSFWDENQTIYYGMARVTEVTLGVSKSSLNLTLDREIAEAQAGAYVINEETINRDMVIRNCTSTPKGRNVGVRQRTPILYQNCDFQNIHFWTYMGEPWRTRPRNVVFDNCTINERMSFNVDDTWNLTLKNCTINAGIADLNNVPTIIMDGVKFTNQSDNAISLRNKAHAYVFGEYAYNGDKSALESKHDKDFSSTINFEQPEDYPSYAPPFLPKERVTEDIIYIDEPFDISGTTLTDVGSGNGWKANWTASNIGLSIDETTSLEYPSGVELNTTGGHILETANNRSSERFFEAPVSLASGTFYLSFLAKKTLDGAFRLETNNSSNHTRFGVSVATNGVVTAQSGTGKTNSNTGLFQNDITYLVVVKYSNTAGESSETRIKLYKEGDQLPEDDSNIVWDVQSEPLSTGADQDRLTITIEGSTVALDEILVGNTFKAVTYDKDYVVTALSDVLPSATHQLILKNHTDGVNIVLPQMGGELLLYDMMGRLLYANKQVSANTLFMPDYILNKGSGVKIIKYQVKDKLYTSKVLR